MIRIGITQGDINGIGYELILKIFQNEEMLTLCTPVIYGSPKVATYHRKALNNQTNFIVRDSIEQVQDHSVNMINCFGEAELKVDLGKQSKEADEAAITSLNCALEDLKNGNIDALVTAPVNQNIFKALGAENEVQYICQQTAQEKAPLAIYAHGSLRIAMATENMPISQVAGAITKERIATKLVALHNSLKRDYFIDNPRIAVLSLNPKNGENEFTGTEETEIITPTLEEMFKAGLRCFGPYSSDNIFADNNYQHFDAILTMFSDQGLTPFHTMTQGEGIQYVAGITHTITSPTCGVSYDIAGKDEADESSMRNAIYSAIDISRSRARYESERAHPLRKQYYEKRDDSDKLKLDQVSEDETL